MEDEDVTQTEDWIDPEHLQHTSVPVFRVGLAAEEESDQQVELLHRFSPSPVSGILRRAMAQPPQPEIIMVQSDSDGPAPQSPKISSEDSDGDMPVLDPNEFGVEQACQEMDIKLSISQWISNCR
jgi:hypothetical protein